jgi:hypothetical protein
VSEKHLPSYEVFKTLLNKDAVINIIQERFSSDIFQGSVSFSNDNIFTISNDNNKRLNIFKDGVFVDTQPLTVKNGVILYNNNNENSPIKEND